MNKHLPSTYSVLIIEDEINTREFIGSLIKDNFSAFTIVGTASSVKQGVALINQKRPDLVLMDIEILGGTGFDILKATSNLNYEVIFITSYLEYSIEALRVSALDYVLKPLVVADFNNAIDRFIAKVSANESDKSILLIEGLHRQLSLPLENIMYVEVKKGQCIFKLLDGKTMFSIKGINHYSEQLVYPIYLAHRRFYINIKCIAEMDRGRGGFVTLKSYDRIPIAYRRKKDIEDSWLNFLKFDI